MNNPSSTYFEKVAGQWDTLRSGYFGEAVRTAAIAKAYLRPEMTAADIGAGTGFMAAGLAPLVHKVHVLDGSPEMLAVARQNLAGFANIETHLAEAQALGLPNESVDAAFANMYLHHCPDPLAAIREMVRLLKPGGRLVITDMDTHPHAWMQAEMSDLWLGFERAQVRAWFQEAGLVNIIVDCSGQDCCAKPANPGPADQTAQISVFVASGAKRVEMRARVQSAYTAAVTSGSCCGETAPEEKQAPEAQAGCCGGQAEETQAGCCGGQAEQSQAGCCGEASQIVPIQDTVYHDSYSAEELASIPSEAGQISLGCGNPTAVANLKPGEVVVDIGSGGGIDSFLAAKKVGPGGKVIGVDMTPAMLERARASAAKAGIHNVEFRQGQAEALPVADRSADVILSNCMINLCEDKGVVFNEAFRVLKPGGRLEVSDMVTSQALPLAARQDVAGWAACVSGALPEQEYLDLIVQAGFQPPTVLRSAVAEEVGGAKIYSAIVSARKPG
jgi:arsenite methyltransferase